MPPGKRPKKPPAETAKVNGMTNDGLILNTDNILLKLKVILRLLSSEIYV